MNSPIRFRTAQRGDGSKLWQLVQSTGSLELNSSYFYLVYAEFFGETCLLAERDNEVVGAIVAFRPPHRNEALFVWQIGVLPKAQKQGLGKRMLRQLLLQPSSHDVRYLLATVTPGNAASQYMFRSFAKSLNAPFEKSAFFQSELFPEPHEDEELISIGPLPANLQDSQGDTNVTDNTLDREIEPYFQTNAHKLKRE